MSFHTPLCDLLKVEHPIIQAPIGSASCPELVAAVSNAGGLGLLSMSWREPDEIKTVLERTRHLTGKPFGVNFVLDAPVITERPFEPRLALCLDAQVPVMTLSWGQLTPDLVGQIHQAGSLVGYTVWDVEQALHAVHCGVDFLVAQGVEAGGHLNSRMMTMMLVSMIVQAFPAIPVVAAGGIATGADMVQAFGKGAAGVWLGTRFVASEESLAHDVHKQAILAANAEDTVLNTLYNIGWPNAPHRTIKNSTYQAWESTGKPDNQRPGEGEAIAAFPDASPIYRYADVPPLRGMSGDLEGLALYAGTSVSAIHQVLPAAEIIQQLLSQAEAADRAHAGISFG